MAAAVTIEQISKRYTLGDRAPYGRLTESIAGAFRRPGKSNGDERTLWALRDVSFQVEPGDVLGIIGRNGAGKTTLLKILSRITEPTNGRVSLRGRVGSLLEVGTGFHPELSGRDNVYLNGAILGMRRKEIERKFEEIVEFAEIGRFLETPVKRYSSGMYVRLAFAVAAHLEPEILIVDEVLAVGDVAFQRKCLGKMSDIARGGRTVLFVSHNMAAVENLCSRGVVLDGGSVVFDGETSSAISSYLHSIPGSGVPVRDRTDRQGSGELRVTSVDVRDVAGNPLPAVAAGQTVDLVLEYEARPGFSRKNIVASVAVNSQFDVPVFLHHNRLTGNDFGAVPERGAFILRIPSVTLTPGTYRVRFSVLAGTDYLDAMSDAFELTVVGGDFFGTGELPPATHGIVLVAGEWRIEGAA